MWPAEIPEEEADDIQKGGEPVGVDVRDDIIVAACFQVDSSSASVQDDWFTASVQDDSFTGSAPDDSFTASDLDDLSTHSVPDDSSTVSSSDLTMASARCMHFQCPKKYLTNKTLVLNCFQV